MSAPTPSRGEGYVSVATPCLTVTFASHPWWLQVTRPDGEGYLEFAPFHGRAVTARDVARFVPRYRELAWREVRALPGMPAACEATEGDYLVHLAATKGSDLGPAALQEAFRAFMAAAGGRRLT